MSFVILATTASRQAFVFGTPKTGAPFVSEESAKRAADKLEGERPHLSTLVLDLLSVPGPGPVSL